MYKGALHSKYIRHIVHQCQNCCFLGHSNHHCSCVLELRLSCCGQSIRKSFLYCTKHNACANGLYNDRYQLLLLMLVSFSPWNVYFPIEYESEDQNVGMHCKILKFTWWQYCYIVSYMYKYNKTDISNVYNSMLWSTWISSKKCEGLNGKLNDSPLVYSSDHLIWVVYPSHAKFLL